MKTHTFVLLTCLSLCSCNRKKEPTPEEKAAEEKEREKELKRGKKVLKTVASLEDKLDSAPSKMKSSVLEGARNGYCNFDVLFDDELSKPKQVPKVKILTTGALRECAAAVEAKKVYPTDCSTKYVVVLKPRTFKEAKVSGSSYTPGSIDADAYVFDLSDGELIGGGRVTGETPDSFSTKSSNPENDLAEKLGASTFDSLAEALKVKKK